MPAHFDRLARLYHPLEFVTLGPLLRRTREHFLTRLNQRQQALVLGDGDGRFLARLLAGSPTLRADAVDSSAGMLRQLRGRCSRAAPDVARRLTTHHQDALEFARVALPFVPAPDLVVTHFLLDCLHPAQVAELAGRISQRLPDGALWVVSEFHIPANGPMRPIARIMVRSLYLAFRLLAGLRVAQLPEHAPALHAAGLRCIGRHTRLGGLLLSELWQKLEPPVELSRAHIS